MNNPNPDPVPEFERLVDLAAELGVPVEQLASNLADDVTHDAAGFRCISVELATVLLDDKRRSDAEALEQSRRRQAEQLSRRQAQRQAQADLEVQRAVRSARVDALVAGGLTPALAVTVVDGPPVYDGDRGIPRPSSNPFTFQEGGGSIGPPIPPRRNRKAAP